MPRTKRTPSPRRSKPKRPLPAHHAEPPLTREEAEASSAELLSELARTPGDLEAVTQTMFRWLDAEGSRDLGLICLSALTKLFVECVSPMPSPPPSPPPPGALELSTPGGTTHA